MDANKTDSVAVLRAADLPALWRQRAARKKQCGLPKEAELDLTHAAELEAALSAQGEAVAWQYRVRKLFSDGWLDWHDCTQELAAEIAEGGSFGGRTAEARVLYTAPGGVGDAVTEEIAQRIAELIAAEMPSGYLVLRCVELAVKEALAARTGQGEA